MDTGQGAANVGGNNENGNKQVHSLCVDSHAIYYIVNEIVCYVVLSIA